MSGSDSDPYANRDAYSNADSFAKRKSDSHADPCIAAVQ